MNIKNNVNLFCLFVSFCVLFVGCQTIQEIKVATPEPLQIATSTIKPLVTALPTFVDPSKLTPTLQPSLTPLSSPTVLPTQPSFYKVRELDIQGTAIDGSSDGLNLIVSDSINDNFFLFNMAKQEILWQFSYPTGGMSGYPAIISSDGNLVAVSQVERDLYILDGQLGGVLHQINDPHEYNLSLSFSSNGQLLAVSSSETYIGPFITVYDTQSGETVEQFISPNNYSTSDNKPLDLVGQSWYVEDAVFLPNQSNVMVITIQTPMAEKTDKSWAVYLWDIDKKQIKQWLPGILGGEIAISQNGSKLAVVVDKKILVWDIEKEEFLFDLDAGERALQAIDISNEGHIAWLDWKYNFALWDPNGKLITEITPDTSPDQIIGEVLFNSEGQLLIAYLGDKVSLPLEIWEIK